MAVLRYCGYRNNPNVFCTDGAVESIAWCVRLKLLFWSGTSDMLSRETWEACQISCRQGNGLRQPKSLTQQKRKEAPRLSLKHPGQYYNNTYISQIYCYFALWCIISLFLLGHHKSCQVGVTAFFMGKNGPLIYTTTSLSAVASTLFCLFFMSCSVNSKQFWLHQIVKTCQCNTMEFYFQ